MIKRGFIIVVLKPGSRPKDVSVTRDDNTSSIGRCVSCWLVVLFTKECQGVDTGMTYRWVYGTLHWTVTCAVSSSAREWSHAGYGYKCPLDLRLPWWLISNSLYFGTWLTGHCDLVYGWWLGAVKYLGSLCASQDGNDLSNCWSNMYNCMSIEQSLGRGSLCECHTACNRLICIWPPGLAGVRSHLEHMGHRDGLYGNHMP